MKAITEHWADLLGMPRDSTRGQLLRALRGSTYNFTRAELDRIVDDTPHLWQWREGKPGTYSVKVVQSWENRPTRGEWRRLKQWFRECVVPAGVPVEFRGCPRPEPCR